MNQNMTYDCSSGLEIQDVHYCPLLQSYKVNYKLLHCNMTVLSKNAAAGRGEAECDGRDSGNLVSQSAEGKSAPDAHVTPSRFCYRLVPHKCSCNDTCMHQADCGAVCATKKQLRFGIVIMCVYCT